NGEAHAEGDGARRRRRRGRRGGRRNRREDEFGVNGNGEAHEANGAELAAIPESTGIAEAPVAAEAAPAPEVAEVAIAAAAPVTPEVVAAAEGGEAPAEAPPKRTRRKKAETAEGAAAEAP